MARVSHHHSIRMLLVLTACSVCCGGQSSCNISESGSDVTADCSLRHLQDVPDELPRTTTILNLFGNQLDVLKWSVFSHLTELRVLDLSNNSIASMQTGCFCGLALLQSLNLSSNNLTMNTETYSKDVFKPLRNLRSISLSNNTHEALRSYDYPDEALSRLCSLEDLYIDGIPEKEFGPGMLKLVNLTTLFISGVGTAGICSINSLSSSFFLNLKHLTNVTLTGCNISTTANETFSKLPHILSLDLSWNYNLKLSGFTNVTSGLRNSKIRTLKMAGIHPVCSLSIMLKMKHAMYMRNLPLFELDIGFNNLELFEEGVLARHFPKTIEKLVLDGNRLMVAAYFNELPCLEKLQDLSISDQSNFDIFAKCYPHDRSSYGVQFNASKSSLHNCVSYTNSDMFPPSLKRLHLENNGMREEMGVINFTGNVVEYINLSSNNFHKWRGPFIGVSRLETLDLSNNFCVHVNSTFFENMIGLKYLKLDSNRLHQISYDANGTIFNKLSDLETLSIRFNGIYVLPRKLFKNLGKLTKFDFYDNTLTTFDADLSGNPNLSVMDLSYNRISWISERTRTDMDKLAIGANFTLNLENNHLKCVCDESNMHLLQWIYSTNVQLIKRDIYRCYDHNNQLMSMKKTYAKLKKECSKISTTTIILSATGGSLFILLMVAVLVAFKYRWRLKYIYYLRRARHSNGYTSLNECYNDETYDAFISYADEDRMFVKNDIVDKLETEAGLKLCIHHRDFMPGLPIEDNIASALRKSKWMVVLLTKYYVASKWCIFEFNMAREECMYNNRGHMLIMVEYKPMTREELPPVIQEEREFNTYSAYPQGNADDTKFWRHLVQSLKSK